MKSTQAQIVLTAIIINVAHSYSFLPQRSLAIFPTSSSSTCRTTSTSTHSSTNLLEMKVSKGKSKHGKGNSLHTINQTRKRIAGKAGTKHFLNPNKVFIGNLSYDATEQDVTNFLKKHLGGMQSVESVKIISDWKTGKSKGYGFVQFIEPMFATSAMESIKNKKLKGRVIRLDQGRKKDDIQNRMLFVKNRVNRKTDKESQVIDEALDQAEGLSSASAGEDEELDLDDFDDDDDDLLFSDEDDDDDDEDSEFDGWFEEVYGGSKWEELTEEEAKDMNREQKRKAQRMKPRRKLPRTGFGA